MRLDQFLVLTEICSRSESKKYAKKGRIAVNGQIVKDTSLHIDENKDTVSFDGKVIEYEKYHYFMLNKPQGCVSATKDGLSDTVLDLLDGEVRKNLFPVGRLDKDTEGLLIITDDGALAHNLLSPKKHVDKSYYVRSDKGLTQENIKAIEEGIDIGDEKSTLPARVELLDEENSYILTICEGRFHQVKRMFGACGCTVTYLKRLSMGSLKLDEELEPGEYRRLSEEEVRLLQS